MLIFKIENLKSVKLNEGLSRYFHHAKSKRGSARTSYITQGTYDYLVKSSKMKFVAIEAERTEISSDVEASLESRIISKLEALLSDSPPRSVVEEIKVMLWLNPKLTLRYLGRNLETGQKLENDPNLFCIDIAGGRRCYYWQCLWTVEAETDPSPFEHFHELKQWFQTPDTRIILCIGSGGMRMYGATALLKILDLLDIRSNIHEIWGSSGGSLVAYPYSEGVAPQWIEQIGYDFYNNRYPEINLTGLHFRTFLNLGRQAFQILKDLKPGIINFQKSLKIAVDEAVLKKDKLKKKIPFYAISTSTRGHTFSVLTEEENIEKYHGDFLCKCKSLQAMAASAAIPIIFKPELIQMPKGTMEYWLDGYLNEEIPLVSPYHKWQLDRKNRPDTTPKKLKIFYIDLGMRCSELEFLRKSKNASLVGKKMKGIASFIDKVLDYRLDQVVKILNSVESVEVVGVRVELGMLGVLDTRTIPLIIQRSREFFTRSLGKGFFKRWTPPKI
ncbi:MAG: patatin-like phospholipase family protein [Bdellovibrionia bacterium]